MKETVKTSRTAGYLEKMFRALNEAYFDGLVEEPIITIQSTPRAYGHVTVGKAWRKGQEQRRELNIGAGTLDRPIENVVATLIHEMVHLCKTAYRIAAGAGPITTNGLRLRQKRGGYPSAMIPALGGASRSPQNP